MERTTSADGTTLAFERFGDGPPVVLLPGALCTRGVLAPLAETLAGAGVPAVIVDRRGRGDSGDRTPGPPWSVEREVEDVAAVLALLGAVRGLYGHSSGAAVALHAAASGADVGRLVLHDAPWTPAGAPSDGPAAWSARLAALVADGRGGDAAEAFMAMVGVPAEAVTQMRQGPGWAGFEQVGPTLGYDSAAMGDAGGGHVPTALLATVTAPTLVLAGGADHPFMREVAQEAAAALPDATLTTIDAGHDAPPDVVVPALLPFLTA